MKSKESNKLIAVPLILGLLSILSFSIYIYSANHVPYEYIGVIFIGPILSFIGVFIPIITRKSRNVYPTLWTIGLIVCSIGFVLCILILLILVMIAMAMARGDWL